MSFFKLSLFKLILMLQLGHLIVVPNLEPLTGILALQFGQVISKFYLEIALLIALCKALLLILIFTLDLDNFYSPPSQNYKTGG